jgi:hypothetical protein
MPDDPTLCVYDQKHSAKTDIDKGILPFNIWYDVLGKGLFEYEQGSWTWPPLSLRQVVLSPNAPCLPLAIHITNATEF